MIVLARKETKDKKSQILAIVSRIFILVQIFSDGVQESECI